MFDINTFNKNINNFHIEENENIEKIKKDIKDNFNITTNSVFQYYFSDKYDKLALKKFIQKLITNEDNNACFYVAVENSDNKLLKVTIDWDFVKYGLRLGDLGMEHEKVVMTILDDAFNYSVAGNKEFLGEYLAKDLFSHFMTPEEIKDLNFDYVESVLLNATSRCIKRLGFSVEHYIIENRIHFNLMW